MKPYVHAILSAKKYGGHPDEYLDIHEFLDSSKAHVPDMRHRALLHNSFGSYIAQELFGNHRTNSAGREYITRDICEEHIIQDLGKIPTVQDYLEGMPMYDWIGGMKSHHKTIRMVD